MKYKDLNNNVHDIEAGFESLLPTGSVSITDAEALAMIAPTTAEKNKIRKKGISLEGGLAIARNVKGYRAKDSIAKIFEREVNQLMQNADLDDIVINGGTLTTAQQTMKTDFREFKSLVNDVRAMIKTAKAGTTTVAAFKSNLTSKSY